MFMSKKVTTTTTTTTVTTEVTDSKKEVKPTQIVMVLDRSGSMDSIGKATVDGINSFIKEQKAAEGEAFMTLTQFDDQYEVTYKERPINEVKDLILGETFVPRATTALYDAIGRTINELNTEDDVVFVIVTDGMENASREFTQSVIFEKIEQKKKEGWNFLFLAANQDAMKTGAGFGISGKNAMSYNANSTSVNATFSNISGKMSSYRSAKFSVAADLAADSLNFTESDREEVKK